MAWITLSEAYLKTRLSGTELDTVRKTGVNVGELDPIASILAIVSNQVRRYVAANKENTLGLAGTIPEQLVSEALDLACWESMKRGGGQIIDPKDARKEAYQQAIQSLQSIGKNSEPIEQPTSVLDPSIMPTSNLDYGSDAQLEL
jgi:hypothetical protein